MLIAYVLVQGDKVNDFVNFCFVFFLDIWLRL